MSADWVLVDTNVFVYATDEASPFCPAASAFLDVAGQGSFVACVAPQILLEFVSVVTNPKRVAVARSAEEAWTTAEAIADAFMVLQPPVDLFERALTLGRTLGMRKQDVFDLTLGLTALASDVTRVCTYDSSLFSKLPGLTAERPESFLT